MKNLNIHLISDFSTETLMSVVNSSLLQFEGIKPKIYVWPLVRNDEAVEQCLKTIEKKPGMVLYIIAASDLRDRVKNFCFEKKLPCIGVLGKVIKEMSAFLGIPALNEHSEFRMDSDYFERMEAIDFTLKHDDGQKLSNLEEADIVLLGPSRTSKSPTCVYLAFNGLKAANIPIVPNLSLPDEITSLNNPLIVGLIIDPKRLVEVRNNRLNVATYSTKVDYTDYDKVVQECREAKRLFAAFNWPIIDVTMKSVEEIASDILRMYYEKKQKFGQKVMSTN
ncbi:MAG: synthetase regulatory protein [Rickettsiaceae bacterium]|nr:synthetase regulatory protein [Rickettsiaceae bacterium]